MKAELSETIVSLTSTAVGGNLIAGGAAGSALTFGLVAENPAFYITGSFVFIATALQIIFNMKPLRDMNKELRQKSERDEAVINILRTHVAAIGGVESLKELDEKLLEAIIAKDVKATDS